MSVTDKQEKKEMLSVSKLPDGRTHVKINYSSLSILNTCMRKAHYQLDQQLVSREESEALTFGKGVHKALESWYQAPEEVRADLPSGLRSKLGLEILGQPQGDHPAFVAVREFAQEAHTLAGLPDDNRRSLLNGSKILAEYFVRYSDDGLSVVSDKDGPIVERRVEFDIHEDAKLKVTYFGTIDAILKNSKTGIVCVVDHKTTSALGTQFFQRIKPNHQYTGYVWGAQQVLGIDTQLFLVNGIQVVKTKQSFARQFTERTPEDFMELRWAVVRAVESYLVARETGIWVQNAPDPCTNWGGCAFGKVCEVPNNLRNAVISANWERA